MSVYTWLGRVLYWVVWPASWLYLRGSRRTRVLLMCNEEILVVQNWLGTGKWNLPGGGLHKGEDPVLGLIRETLEETGVRLTKAKVRLLSEEWFRMHGFKYQCFYFAADVAIKPVVVRQRLEIVDTAWVRIDGTSSEHYGKDVTRALALLDSVKHL